MSAPSFVHEVMEDGVAFKEIALDRLVASAPELADAPIAQLIMLESVIRRLAMTAVPAWGEVVQYYPHRVLMQDYAGTPTLLDIAGLRHRHVKAGGKAEDIKLARPTHLVIDHSVVNTATGQGSERVNLDQEYRDNEERFVFLRWAEQAFENLEVVPSGGGIVHQVNLEQWCEPVRAEAGWMHPDSLVGTDSHSTMAGGIGILAWGVGGIEAMSVLLDQPVEMAQPEFVGLELVGAPPPGVMATDIALRLTAFLRSHGVVGSIVECFGPGAAALTVADRATVSNMAPEYGATATLFPPDEIACAYLASVGKIAAAERLSAYLGRHKVLQPRQRRYNRVLTFDLALVVPTVSGPSLPHQVQTLDQVKTAFEDAPRGEALSSGDVVIAAITSCTNTANPAAMVAAGLVARKAVELGLEVPTHVRTSLSPGSRQVIAYLEQLGLLEPLQKLGFWVTGVGCMTCVGNSGNLVRGLAEQITEASLNVAAVLSGNRNFQARIHPAVQSNFLASPPLVVALAIAGHLRMDIANDPLTRGPDGRPVYLSDLWPQDAKVQALVSSIRFSQSVSNPHLDRWEALETPQGDLFSWPSDSTYICLPGLFSDVPGEQILAPARPLLVLGDLITTDHISPVGRIDPQSPAGRYLTDCAVPVHAFGTYGARRGNPEVMARGTFANPRLAHALGQGWTTRHIPSGDSGDLHQVAKRYRDEGQPLVIVAGENYGVGSARDWAAKGIRALGVKAVLARSFERIHRSNLALVGVLPVELPDNASVTPETLVSIDMPSSKIDPGINLLITLTTHGESVVVRGRCRLDTPFEVSCWRRGGLLSGK
ncbi:aconitate hydratase AcnA [Devosia sp. A449]